MNIHFFPILNASLNGLAGILLFAGWLAIKRGDQRLHRRLMLIALGTSALFLCSYVTYHVLIHGVTRYQHRGFIRALYFFILGTHTPLAVIIVPFCLLAVRFALRG